MKHTNYHFKYCWFDVIPCYCERKKELHFKSRMVKNIYIYTQIKKESFSSCKAFLPSKEQKRLQPFKEDMSR